MTIALVIRNPSNAEINVARWWGMRFPFLDGLTVPGRRNIRLCGQDGHRKRGQSQGKAGCSAQNGADDGDKV